jgi:CO/xanthine dehydrogenase Mo-binding subunit
MNIRFDPQLVFENNAVKGRGATYPLQSILAPNAKAGPLKIETVGPISLLPNGQKCGLHFEANGTVLIALGMRDYGHGYASSYFANLLVARLGSAFERIRVYYAGGFPAVRCTPKHAPHIQSRDNVCVATAEVGDLIETLCDQAVEKGRRLLASSIGVQPSDIDFEASSGRFFVADGGLYVDASEIARRTGNAEHGRPSCRRGPRGDTPPGAVALSPNEAG